MPALVSHLRAAAQEGAQAAFQRGDSDGDGKVGLSDALWTLTLLFLNEGERQCDDATDANDDGQIDVGDPLTILFFLYGGGPDLPPPGPAGCGGDPTEDSLQCLFHARCRTVVIQDFAVSMLVPQAAEVAWSQDAWPDAVTVRTGGELEAELRSPYAGKVIYVADDAEIDLTDFKTLPIPGGVTLAGGRRRLERGGLLYTTSLRKTVLFEVQGDYARVTGLRFRGPSPATDQQLESAVAILVPDAYWVKIEHNEFYDWTGAGVQVEESTPDHCVREVNRLHQVLIAGNYFHHDQSQGLGYGVVAYRGGFPYVVANVFDHNRHAIAADGRPRTGYRAHLNFVLSGGEEYCNGEGFCWYEHHFDMHGRGEGSLGGVAGEYVDVAYNTFRGEQEYALGLKTRAAFYLRGTPCESAGFHHNVAVHEADEAVRSLSQEDKLFAYENQYDVDTSQDLAVGDFDGDGLDDVFTATGAAWYYSSGGQAEWRYLNGSGERLRGLLLGDFDGNGITDVLLQKESGWLISYDGARPPERVNASATPIDQCRIGDFDGDGKADVFRADGERWYVSWGALTRWEELRPATHRLKDLRFGDFDRDGRTDAFAIAGVDWLVSWGGRSDWERLNAALSPEIGSLVLADFDGNGVTDIAESSGGRWQVSRDGRSGWQVLRETGLSDFDRLTGHLIGEFDALPGADALRYQVLPDPLSPTELIEGNRFEISSGASSPPAPHSRYDMR